MRRELHDSTRAQGARRSYEELFDQVLPLNAKVSSDLAEYGTQGTDPERWAAGI